MACALDDQTFYKIGTHEIGARLTKPSFCTAIIVTIVMFRAAAGIASAASPPVSLLPSSYTLAFGNQPVNTTSSSQTATVINNQSVTLHFSSIQISGPFQQTNTCGSSIAGNSSCTLAVVFKPTATGSASGLITLTDDASNSPQYFSLSGTGATGGGGGPTVTLSPGDNIQNAVNANPSGTTFLLQPGIYRNDSIVPKNGDSFIGNSGAILNGSKVLTGWTQASINGVLYWTTAGGTPLPNLTCPVFYGCCTSAYPRCTDPQDLYIDGVEYQSVASLANVVAGMSWYYDFGGTDGGIPNNIYLASGNNPNSHVVELGNLASAFNGSASNVTIKNLTIEEYATPIMLGTINVQGPNWLIQNNEIRLNHGEGISAAPGGDSIQVLGNNVHHNGELGVGSPGNGGLWDSNTIAYNNTDGVSSEWEAGGTKFEGSNIMISNNIVHDNNGEGLFTDGGGTYNTYNHNTSYNNVGGGIRYEVSRYGTITNNTVYDNPGSNPQIVYTGSDHGRISGNTVVDNGSGGIEVWNIIGTRPNAIGPLYQITDVQVTGNTIWIPSNGSAVAVGLQDFASPPQPSIYSDPTNFFDHNIYQFSNGVRNSWLWGEVANLYIPISWGAWQADGQDPHGQIMLNVPSPH